MQMHDRRVEGVCCVRKPGTESLGNGVYETTDMKGMLEDSNKESMNGMLEDGARPPRGARRARVLLRLGAAFFISERRTGEYPNKATQ